MKAALLAGAQALGLHLNDGQAGQLLAYLRLLAKWNRVYNLTAVRDGADMLTRHVLDSLAVALPLKNHAQGRALKLLDAGSGGGLPGVALAICCPEMQVTCADAVAKKAAFIQQAAATLKLPHLRGLHARVETLAGPFDVITSRAFASLADFTRWTAQALAQDGVWLAMKGRHPADELAALPPEVQVFHVEPLSVPHLQAERCLIWLRKAEPAEKSPSSSRNHAYSCPAFSA